MPTSAGIAAVRSIPLPKELTVDPKESLDTALARVVKYQGGPMAVIEHFQSVYRNKAHSQKKNEEVKQIRNLTAGLTPEALAALLAKANAK